MSKKQSFKANRITLWGEKTVEGEEVDFVSFTSREIRGGSFRPCIKFLEIAEMPYLLLTSKFDLNGNDSGGKSTANCLEIYLPLKSARKLGKLLRKKYGEGQPEDVHANPCNEETENNGGKKSFPFVEEGYSAKFHSLVADIAGRPLAYQNLDGDQMEILRVHPQSDHKPRGKEIFIKFKFESEKDLYVSAKDYCENLKITYEPNPETALPKDYSEAYGTGTGLVTVTLTRGQAADLGYALEQLIASNDGYN